MKRVVVGLLLIVAGGAAILSICAARYQSVVRPNTRVGPVSVGGLVPEEAAKKLRLWWETAKREPLKLQNAKLKKELTDATPGQLGVTLDDAATVAKLPLQDLTDDIKSTVTREEFSEGKFEMVFKGNGTPPVELAKTIREVAGPPHVARAVWQNGAVVKFPEVSSYELDKAKLQDAVVASLKDSTPVEIPIKEAPKTVPDEELAKITDVVSEFTTHFPTSKVTRCQNIKLASSRFNGVVLMPGEKLSFNEVVGQRTLKAGFKVAGVLKQGRHDTGVGGGICQVSTTLYNAVLLGNFSVKQRSNHSTPVPYVPPGRDATVDWGSLDMVFENTYSTPIAVMATYEPGTLNFRILGQRDPSMTVKILEGPVTVQPYGLKLVKDPSLRAGAKVIVEKGSYKRSLRTYRVVYKDGKPVKRETLGRSYYPGSDRIVSVGTKGVPLIPKVSPGLPASIPNSAPPPGLSVPFA